MKLGAFLGFLVLFLGSVVLLYGCATSPTVSEYMIVSPKAVTFAKYDSVEAVSITHSCTCPFSWHATLIPDSAADWLVFPRDTVGDHSSVRISVLPSKMTQDTNEAVIAIRSNSYGSDTIHVVAYR